MTYYENGSPVEAVGFDYDALDGTEPQGNSVVDGLTLPAIAHALNWIDAPKDNQQKLVRLEALRVQLGVSNTFAAACSIRVDQSTIQKAVKRTREEFGL